MNKIRPPPYNHKIRLLNRNLEAMSRLLYDYWFVQFDFPDENGSRTSRAAARWFGTMNYDGRYPKSGQQNHSLILLCLLMDWPAKNSGQ